MGLELKLQEDRPQARSLSLQRLNSQSWEARQDPNLSLTTLLDRGRPSGHQEKTLPLAVLLLSVPLHAPQSCMWEEPKLSG